MDIKEFIDVDSIIKSIKHAEERRVVFIEQLDEPDVDVDVIRNNINSLESEIKSRKEQLKEREKEAQNVQPT